ncbi:hypothetical protein [Microbacterium sp. Root1433D1]|uniref:hypothetical protein n=1 Tax=Microbacterium sp. Root1433D1 TaxID=1736463 RepID=UPI001F2157E7|nr:hypothetical protein [Microbacterium sp. Root1433D1]
MIPPTASSAIPRRSGALMMVSIVVMLAGCAPTPEPTPTPTAAFASEEEAFAAAEETYRAYTDALNAVDLDDPATFEPVFDLTSGDFEAADRQTLSELHAEKYAFTGQMTVVRFNGISSHSSFEQVEASVCVDVSGSDVVDESGNSVTSPDRPDMNPLRVTFVLSDGRLRVDRADRDPGTACSG